MKLIDAKKTKLVFTQDIFERLLARVTQERDAMGFLKLLKIRDKIISKIQND
jgi:hypothetical protein